VTGWGQSGPLSQAAGHDLNYVALSGMLHAMGRDGSPPAPPLNLVGDFGGGAMMLAFGVVCAAFEAKQSGKGQVVDAAMTDGAALLGAMMYGLRAFGSWSDQRESNLLDGGAPFYDCYACADGKFISIGAIEPQFYAQLLQLAGVEDPQFRKQWRQADWPELKRKFAACSPPARATTGARCWKGPTSASPPCSTWRRRRATRTTRRAPPSWSVTA
jgi:alpha-methylacyl-CoA racemase